MNALTVTPFLNTKHTTTPTSTDLTLPAPRLDVLMSQLISSAHGSIESYMNAVNKTPLLSPEEELRLAYRLRDHDDIEAAQRLIVSHLRLVVSTARHYLGYGLPMADLIQEGNIGLMKAVKKFDVERGVRLVSFALHWIKAEIHEYIIKNWRMVKIATTKPQRKLFFNLRSLKIASEAEREDHQQGHTGLIASDIEKITKTLNVSEAEVREMDVRMMGGDVLLDTFIDNEEESYAPISWLEDNRTEPTQVIARKEFDRVLDKGLLFSLARLDPRSQRIVQSRWLVNDGEEPLTLHDLAAEFDVSAERIRQIELAAFKKMRQMIQNKSGFAG